MGKVQCTSSKTHRMKDQSFEDQIFQSLNRSYDTFDQAVLDEYNSLKKAIESNASSPDDIFGFSNYKVRLNKLMKWSIIAFKDKAHMQNSPKRVNKLISLCF